MFYCRHKYCFASKILKALIFSVWHNFVSMEDEKFVTETHILFRYTSKVVNPVANFMRGLL